MNECPVCESAATDVQMAKAALKATREEMERLTADNTALRTAYAKDTGRLRAERDHWKAIAMQHVVDRTFVMEDA